VDGFRVRRWRVRGWTSQGLELKMPTLGRARVTAVVGLGKSSDVVRSACLCSSWGIDVRNVPLSIWLNQYVLFKLGGLFWSLFSEIGRIRYRRLRGVCAWIFGTGNHALMGLSLYRSVDHILLSVVGAKSQKRKLVFVEMSEKSDYERVETQEK
jgi:hypothetical protein